MIGPHRWRRLLLCAVVAAILYLPHLGRPALWEPDEGRYAEIAREMALSGDYVTPRNDFVRYFEKPPLVYWISAGAIRLLGANEFAVRLPSALFTIGEVVVVEALGEAMFGAAVGLLSALALALSPLVFTFARFATLDPALAFFMTAGLAAFYLASRAKGFGRGAGQAWFIVAAAMLALGTLAKGPVALLLSGAIALIFILVERRAREIGQIPWFWCIIVYCAIALPWFFLAAERNPGFLSFFILHEHLHRFLGSTEHGWGPWFFVPVVIGGTWPWFFFAPFGVIELFRASRAAAEDARATRSALRFLVIWFVVIFVFFSIPRSKLGTYILPALPPLAIVAGYALRELGQSATATRRLRLAALTAINALVLAVIAAIAFFGPEVVPGLRHLRHAVLIDAVVIAAFVFAGSVGALIAARANRPRAAIAGIIGIAMVFAMATAIHAREDASPLETYRSLARAVRPYLHPGCTLASYRHFVQSLPFYTATREALVDYRGELNEPFSRTHDASDSFIADDADLRALWQAGCTVVIVNRRDAAALTLRLGPPPPAVLGCEGKKLALYNGRITRAPLRRDCEGLTGRD